MNKTILFFCLASSFFWGNSIPAHFEQKLLVGSVQFPKTIESMEDICIYYGGKKINTEVDREGRRISFSLSEKKHRAIFYLLVIDCANMSMQTTDTNTVQYLKTVPNEPYKFYVLELIDGIDKNEKSYWRIKQTRLSDSGHIPDDTIIVCYNPDFVEKIEGGSELEFPKIYIKEDILSIVGSDSLLHDQTVQALLSSIDYNALHSSIKHQVKQNIALKTIIIAPEN
jgi:hypothetical protein